METQKQAKDLIWECLWDIQGTFARDDIKNVSRKTLEDLIMRTADKLQEIVEGDLAWWDLPDEDELMNFRVELAK